MLLPEGRVVASYSDRASRDGEISFPLIGDGTRSSSESLRAC